MLTTSLLNGIRSLRSGAMSTRNLGLLAPAMNKTASDPIQQLFLDKIREYKSKGGKLEDASPEIKKELDREMGKLERQYGGKGDQMTQFPTLKFEEPTIDPIDLEVAKAKDAKPAAKPKAK